ncbi:MAG: nitroreductase family protein [Cytophagales bacterium]|nr:nitroreductase family protein [Cytophagales bacterium]MDW8383433.1 nitroreductase family protein [Flammeovirgaceae bacterium]
MTNVTFESVSKKIAKTQYPVLELLRSRWSARAFAETPISHENLMTLFEAAVWAPSSMNEQPWHFVYAHHHDDVFAKFVDCLVEGNQAWAKNAAVLVLILAKTHHEKGNVPNKYAWYDVGAATTQMLIQAASMNIYGHIMGGFEPKKVYEHFKIPQGYEPVCFTALGYLADPATLSEPFYTREITPRTRKPLTEVVSHKEATI